MAKNSKFFDLLVMAVASGQTIRAAASGIGCSESHAYNISATAEFRNRVSAIRSEATSAAVGRLTDAASQAVATLIELLDASQEPSVRLQAAKAILASVGPLAEATELRDRLDAIEQQRAA